MLTNMKMEREEESIIIDICGELLRTYKVTGIPLLYIPKLIAGLTNPVLLISSIGAEFFWHEYQEDISTKIKNGKVLDRLAQENFFVAYKESVPNNAVFGVKVCKFEKYADEYIKILTESFSSCFHREIRETSDNLILVIKIKTSNIQNALKQEILARYRCTGLFPNTEEEQKELIKERQSLWRMLTNGNLPYDYLESSLCEFTLEEPRYRLADYLTVKKIGYIIKSNSLQDEILFRPQTILSAFLTEDEVKEMAKDDYMETFD